MTQENWPAGVECFGWVEQYEGVWRRRVLRFTYATLAFLCVREDEEYAVEWAVLSRDDALTHHSYMIEAPK